VARLLGELAERRVVVVGAAAGLVVAGVASFTQPFTVGADVVTAVPLCLAVVVLVQRVLADRRSTVGPPPAPVATRPAPAYRRASPWLALVGAVVAWELYSYLSTPRSAHPTLSVLINMFDATQTGKGIAFLLWLALGWYLVVQ